MAELLVMSKDNSNPDHDTRYYKGDIVEVREDGFGWGSEMSHFVIIKIPGLNPSVVQKYMESEHDTVEVDGRFPMRKRRIWGLLVDNVPPSIKQQLRDNREVTVTKAQIRNFLKNKSTQLTETDF